MRCGGRRSPGARSARAIWSAGDEPERLHAERGRRGPDLLAVDVDEADAAQFLCGADDLRPGHAELRDEVVEAAAGVWRVEQEEQEQSLRFHGAHSYPVSAMRRFPLARTLTFTTIRERRRSGGGAADHAQAA